MTILTSIEAFVKYHFGEYVEFERNSNAICKIARKLIAAFYLRNLLILVQGLISERCDSISRKTPRGGCLIHYTHRPGGVGARPGGLFSSPYLKTNIPTT